MSPGCGLLRNPTPRRACGRVAPSSRSTPDKMEAALNRPAGWSAGLFDRRHRCRPCSSTDREEIAPYEVTSAKHPRVTEWWLDTGAAVPSRGRISSPSSRSWTSTGSFHARRCQESRKIPTPTARSCRSRRCGFGPSPSIIPRTNAMSLEMWEGLGHARTELRDNAMSRRDHVGAPATRPLVSGADISQFEKPALTRSLREYSRRSAAARIAGDYRSRPCLHRAASASAAAMQFAMRADIRLPQQPFCIPAAMTRHRLWHDACPISSALGGPSWARLIMYTGHAGSIPSRRCASAWSTAFSRTPNCGARDGHRHTIWPSTTRRWPINKAPSSPSRRC